jgi:DNA mismatch endonuclease (patch repair protein)
LGLRFTTKNRDLPGSPDLANRSKHMAVFVHGCYWHRHPDCVKASVPKTNRRFWERKFERNQARDREAVVALGTMGYRVAVIWECEVGDSNLVAARLQSLEQHRSA